MAHVQDIGWQDYKQNGATSGTTGKNKKIEAMRIELNNAPSGMKIKYRTYVEGDAWQNWKYDDSVSGTTGKNKKVYGIQVKLEGTEQYSVQYRVHLQDLGWQEWVQDGKTAGNISAKKKIEAIQIKIVKNENKDNSLGVWYVAHVQDEGWQDYKYNGGMAGTTGKNRKIEALKIELNNNPSGTGIRYRTYIANSGWQNWAQNGNLSGTVGQNKKVYGIRIELVGMQDYSVQYRVHIENYGWLDWVADGETAGKVVEGKKIEAVEIKITKKVEASKTLGVEYYSHIQNTGWEEKYRERDGETSGRANSGLKIEAIKINLRNAPKGASIKYKAHVKNVGWQDWVSDGEQAGTTDKNQKIEAIKIKLEGLDNYTVEYRVYVQNNGWTDWYIDGEQAGTTGKNLRIEAIQIRLVGKYKRQYYGIDVSEHQEEINYDKLVKTNKVDFMIARAGFYLESQDKFREDYYFKRNYSEAKRKNIPLGTYIYSYATSVEEAKNEATGLISYLKSTGQTDYELPIFFDIEDSCQENLSVKTRTDMCIAFGEIIIKAGYKVGIYSNMNRLLTWIDLKQIPDEYSIWVASYGLNDGKIPGDKFKFPGEHDIWQYTSQGKLDGIEKPVDLNICYKKYF